jgi:PTH1 family peptidyl-tRNA hydrolase
MKLIVGLGNIGKEYQNTRHNLGFGVVDVLSITLGSSPDKFTKHGKAKADVLDLRHEQDCILVKPTTYMNLSGQAVQALVQYFKIELDDVWVVHDEIDLEFGLMRVRKGGGSAGHNGIKSLIGSIGEDFWRIRLGVKNGYLANMPTDKFVLDPFSLEEATKLPQIVEKAADYISSALVEKTIEDHTQALI